MPSRRRRRGDLAVAVAVLATVALAAGADGGAEFDYRKLSGIIIPGFASTQLRAWSVLDCPYSPFDFNPLDSVWLDTAKLFSAVNCWLKCMLLEPYNQTDHPECKSRPDSGLSAITELDPGYITGAPLLGSTEAVRGALSGTTFGLPVSEGTARLMFNAFGSSLWLMPFSKHCKADNIYWKHFFEGKGGCPHKQQCDEDEYISDYGGWPTDLVNIEVPSARDMGAYPSITDITENITSIMECGKPTLLSFSAREVSDGTLFKTIEDYDPQSKALVYQLEKYYQGDPVLNPLTPWERPPIKNVFCIYGIDSKTEVGYYFAPSGKPYPDNWIITDIIYELEGSLLSRQVSYNSLSWCKNWLGPKVNITRAPQAEHDGSDLQTAMNIDHHHGDDILPNMTRVPHVKYITYYEDAESLPGWRTAVWELDKANHRNIVRTPVLMRELWLEMWHDLHPDSKSKFVTKAFRGPLRNEDCRWDYGKARCGFPEHCEYRYTFGDVHLGMSCRLRNTSANLLQQYL
ncbi:Phospholipid--sterol O-acyltransferase [Zea mays]|uniref:Phospholipid--sterol O-acyltransferase n=1 Tax=Zea mays TaxID=4577 RepID=A0A1D6HP69_MAIZE|nr:Phospholipid--sterol O-acyltransferase [Zea mays]